ncbi:MAG TPA: hypothetical protein EYP76_02530, partial [Thiomicrorhabdus sp.]|nr:hypothetical protein [Thiomicrorhabdus sp.]
MSIQVPYQYLLIFLFLIGSGTAAMIYQIVWIRLSTLSVGATSLSLSVVIGAFFLGLGLGSLLSRYFNHQKRPILTTYAILELIIGVSALLLLPTLLNLDHFIASVPLLTEIAALKYLLIGLLLLIPTMAMGATLPLISTLMIQNSQSMGKWYAQVYSLNTFGAVLGALLCGFILVPTIGLDGAVYSAVLANFSIALLALMLAHRGLFLQPKNFSPPPIQTASIPTPSIWTTQKFKALMVLFVTGFVSIATEIGWSKFLIISIGSTIYGFSLLIAILLFAIATGAWVIRKRIDHIQHPSLWLGYALLLLSFLLIMTYTGLSYIAPLQEYLTHSNLNVSTQTTLKYMAIVALIFPPSFLFGVIFPLALSLFTQNSDRVQSDSATAFGLNTLAGILGATLAGFWIIPQFGTATLLLSMAGVTAIVAITFLLPISLKKHRIIVFVFSTIILIAIIFTPPLSYKPLLIAHFNSTEKTHLTEDQITYIKEAKSGVIGIVDHKNQYKRLLNNGLSVATIDYFNNDNADLTASILALLPYLLHTDPNPNKSAFIIGFGGGISLYALTKTPIQSIKVVELEPAVIEAMKSIYPMQKIPALQDKRVTLEIEDARHLLLAQQTRYDMIISQPSHPWLSGASNLFTEEFFNIAKNRLKEDGIYSQWVNLFKMDATTLKAIIKAFSNTFPYATSFVVRGDELILIGSKRPIQPSYQMVDLRIRDPKIQNI